MAPLLYGHAAGAVLLDASAAAAVGTTDACPLCIRHIGCCSMHSKSMPWCTVLHVQTMLASCRFAEV